MVRVPNDDGGEADADAVSTRYLTVADAADTVQLVEVRKPPFVSDGGVSTEANLIALFFKPVAVTQVTAEQAILDDAQSTSCQMRLAKTSSMFDALDAAIRSLFPLMPISAFETSEFPRDAPKLCDVMDRLAAVFDAMETLNSAGLAPSDANRFSDIETLLEFLVQYAGDVAKASLSQLLVADSPTLPALRAMARASSSSAIEPLVAFNPHPTMSRAEVGPTTSTRPSHCPPHTRHPMSEHPPVQPPPTQADNDAQQQAQANASVTRRGRSTSAGPLRIQCG